MMPVRRPRVLSISLWATLVIVSASCHGAPAASSSIEIAAITRQDIIVNVEATGVIEPVDAIAVKSKASGQIMKMPIVVGSQVRANDLLVQVDPRQMQSQYDAAVAALKAAQDNLAAQRIQLAREDTLFHQRAITAQEYEAAVVAHSNAESAVAGAQNNVDIASINLADATVLAPMAGTVIDKSVSLGQVIASATNVVGGGTTLVTIADLGKVLDSALVNESDIGRVKVGQQVTVSVDAYPNQTFLGTVIRISPQAIVQQSVTMFPVLVALDNGARLLLPGMNSDATISITRLVGAVTVPNDAIASAEEVATLSSVLGVARTVADSVRLAASTRASAPRTSASGRSTAKRAATAAGEVALAGGPASGGNAAGTTTHRGIVFVQDSVTQRFMPRVVVLSAGNYDVTQVLSGVAPGERVALLSDVRVQASRDTTLQRIQGRSGIGGITGGGSAGRGGTGRGGAR